MFRQLISKMPMLILSAIMGLNSAGAFARGNTSTTYRCMTKDAVNVLDDGTLNKQIGETHRKDFDGTVIDIKTGHVTYPKSGIREERVVQTTGIFKNEYVLVPSFVFQRKKAIANAATDFILLRIATAQQPQTIFMVFSLSYLITGTCDIVK